MFVFLPVNAIDVKKNLCHGEKNFYSAADAQKKWRANAARSEYISDDYHNFEDFTAAT